MKTMKKFSVLLLAAGLLFNLAGCPNDDEGNKEEEIPAIYDGFYNYPAGRVDANGLLTINNMANSAALLFINSVDGAYYIGTVEAQKSVKVKLSDEKFYAIIAVDKATYEEKTSRASQYTVLTLYSNSVSYQVSVFPAKISGNAQWKMNNYTNYWIQVKTPDLETTYAVVQPQALNRFIPINYYESYDYTLVYSRELKYNGKVVTLLEFNDASQADVVFCTENLPVYTSDFYNPVSEIEIPPTVLVVNNSNIAVRAYYASSQLTNGVDDLLIAGGAQVLLTGFIVNGNTNLINFRSLVWETNKWVTQDIIMKANKVYQITIGSDGNSITAAELNAQDVFD